MQYTDNYQLREPTPATDVVKVGDINYNSRKIDEILHDTQISLADAYDSTRTSANPYNTGDVVMYELLMYKCKEDGVYGNWDATKWERTTAGASGSGGSDVEANPSGTATDTLNKIGIDGTIYGIEGGGGAGGGGCFIDTTNVITTLTGQGTGTSFQDYEATDDCFVVGTIKGDSGAVQVDGVTVAYTSDSNETIGVMIPAKAGQTVSYRMNSSSTLTVYGLTYTTQNIQPLIYSTEEREVGVWTDGKPLYQKSIPFDNTSSNQISIDVSTLSIDNLIQTTLWCEDSRYQVNTYYDTNTDYINSYYDGQDKLLKIRRSSSYFAGTGYATMLYTKTTDTAGSGIWTPAGVPAVHYDTNEKVVGTVEDSDGTIKTLYEKSWWLTIPNQSGGYTFPNTAVSGLDKVISNEYSFAGRGMRSYTYWYSGASIVFDEQLASGISFYFGSSDYAGKELFYTARYTKSSS